MTNNINGIDVSKYFIEVVDEGGSTIDYKIFPNSERLLVEKIFEQNQQLARLQKENNILKQTIKNKNFVAIVEENEKLKARLKTLDDEVLTIEITPDEFEKYKKYRQALEEIRKKITPVCAYCNNIDGLTTWDDCENVCEKGVIKYLKIIDEVLNA